MEFFQEAVASRNLLVWVILLVFLIIFIKVLKSLGKGFFLLLIVVGVAFLLAQIFPDLTRPVVDFVRGGWMGH